MKRFEALSRNQNFDLKEVLVGIIITVLLVVGWLFYVIL
jgi:hypothetical protein